MADTATLTAWLAEAEQALQDVAIGARTVSLTYEGKTVEYNKTNMAALRAHILDLKKQLGLVTAARSRAIGVRF